jgi:hypothetical protein
MQLCDNEDNLLAVGVVSDDLHLKLHHPLLRRRPKLVLSVHRGCATLPLCLARHQHYGAPPHLNQAKCETGCFIKCRSGAFEIKYKQRTISTIVSIMLWP